jgi:protein gp37
MGEKTKIEWCDHTFNPWIGCTKVSPGCDNCYAEAMMDKRWGRVEWGPHGERVLTRPANWKQPFNWQETARAEQEIWETTPTSLRLLVQPPHRPRVFCASLADVFDNQVPEGWRYDLFRMIELTPRLDWLILTKRPENIERQLKLAKVAMPLPNVWLGFSAEDQEHFYRRWGIMCQIPAVVRFCSYEPALGPLRLFQNVQGLHWLICGGESGQGYRDMDLKWAENIRLDCYQAGVKFFFKQCSGKV